MIIRNWNDLKKRYPNGVLFVDGQFVDANQWTEPADVGRIWAFGDYHDSCDEGNTPYTPRVIYLAPGMDALLERVMEEYEFFGYKYEWMIRTY